MPRTDEQRKSRKEKEKKCEHQMVEEKIGVNTQAEFAKLRKELSRPDYVRNGTRQF